MKKLNTTGEKTSECERLNIVATARRKGKEGKTGKKMIRGENG